MRRIGAAGITLAALGTAVFWFWSSRLPAGPERPPLRESKLFHTTFVPAFAGPIPPEGNALWCASFQLAWDRLKDDVAKQPPRIEGAEELSDLLNGAPFPPGALSPDAFFAAAGRPADGVLGTIRTEMARRFPDYTPPLQDAESAGWVAYAYLRAAVEFAVPFLENEGPLRFKDATGRRHDVKSFGVPDDPKDQHERIRKQVRILSYSLKAGVIVVDPCVTSTPHQILLCSVKRRPTLAETWAAVEAQLPSDESGTVLNAGTSFFVPHIVLASTWRFRELEGRSFLNSSLAETSITMASQSVHFVLSRTGASLSSEAKIIYQSIPERLVFDQPFLVVLRTRGRREPFFALWVEHPEVLEAWR